MDMKLEDGLIIAAFTSIVSLIVQLVLRRLDSQRHTKSFQLAIMAEISALLSLIERRKYREALDRGIFDAKVGSLVNMPSLLSLNIQEDYCPVYYNNLDKIPLLDNNKAKEIVLFYALIASLVQDLRPGGVLNNPDYSSSEAFKKDLEILDQAIAIGRKLTK